ncbi:MAG: nitrous oxide reductase accessory protein NosL [Bdellovibrionota bacterium]
MVKITTLFFGFFLFACSALAAGTVCSVCGMPLAEHAKNRIVVQTETASKEPLHMCALSCLKKTIKHDPRYTKIQVADFNHPDKLIAGDKAFFLLKSTKIKTDIGENVMAPYFGAFATEEEAQTAQKKYGEGVVLQGVENALK